MRTYFLTATKAIFAVSISLWMVADSTLRAQPGTVLSHQKISDTEGEFAGTLDDDNHFGVVAEVGDVDGDGTQDIVVSVRNVNDGGSSRGAVWVLFLNTDGTVKSHQKISDTEGGFTGTLDDFDGFGGSVAGVGDLDGDGIQDIAVGARDDDDGGLTRGAVWVLFLNTDGTVKSHQKISDTAGGFTGTLDDGDLFGSSVAGLGDLDGDGVEDIAVGATSDDDGGSNNGAVWVLFLNTNGTVKSHQKISDTEGGFTGTLDDGDNFGVSVAGLGDLDGDGKRDIAVGAFGDNDGGTLRGAVWVLFLNTNGTVKSHQKISDTAGGFTGNLDDGDSFGISVAGVGDLGGDGILDIAVGARYDDDGGFARGAVWVLFLNTNGTVKSHQKISDTEGGFTGNLDDGDQFGRSVAGVGDLDGDGAQDIAVGAVGDDDGGDDHGAVWVLSLDGAPTVPNEPSPPQPEPGGQTLYANDFGDTPVGNFPSDLSYMEGNMQVDNSQGSAMLRLEGVSWFHVPLAADLPERFAIEFDYYAPESSSTLWLAPFDPATAAGRAPSANRVYRRGRHNHITITTLGYGVSFGAGSTNMPKAQGENSAFLYGVVSVRIEVDGQQARLLIDGNQVVMLPTATFERTDIVEFFHAGRRGAAYIGNLRVTAD